MTPMIQSAVATMLIQKPAFAIPMFDSGDRPCLIASISIFPRMAPGIPVKGPQQRKLRIPSMRENMALLPVSAFGDDPGGNAPGCGAT